MLIEAGAWKSGFFSHKWPYELPYRGRQRERTRHIYVDPEQKPISIDDPGRVHSTRARAVGGRTLLCNAASLRFSEQDCCPAGLDGAGEDSSLSYRDLEPYYDRVERLMGVAGSREGSADLPDGVFLPPLKMRCSERLLEKGCRKLRLRLIPVCKAVLTQPYDGRPPCHYCGHCMTGCDGGSAV